MGYNLSHCYSSLSVSVCLSVRAELSRSQFLTDFDEIWNRRLEPDTKEPFCGVKFLSG